MPTPLNIHATTVVSGWTKDYRPQGKAIFEGHIDLKEALIRASEETNVLVVSGVYVTVYHHIELIGGARFDGNLPDNWMEGGL